MNIVLIGFMASGKTTVARKLSELMSYGFADTDSLIENEAGCTIKEIFQEQGEEVFRQLENKVIRSLIDRTYTVVSVGGGAVMFYDNLALLKAIGITVFLDTPLEQIYKNLEGSYRPLIGAAINKDEVEKLYMKRLSTYMQADLVIKTENKSIEDIAREIVVTAKNHKWKQ